MDITTHVKSENTLQGYETINGKECLKMSTVSEITLDGSGSMMGSDMTFEGDIESTSTWYYDYKNGLYIKQKTEAVLEATIAISGQANMTMPMSQESTLDIELISN